MDNPTGEVDVREASRLETFDPVSLSADQIAALDNEAVKRAFNSVLREGQLPQMHRDHGSHSNSNTPD